jgi:hypothetical protein
MQITQAQLTAEAAQMALELRFKDQAIAALEAEVTRLREAAGEGGGHSHGPSHPHEHEAAAEDADAVEGEPS